MTNFTTSLSKILSECLDFRSYWKFKLIWGLILFLIILFIFGKYYNESRVRGVKVASVVTGLEHLKDEKEDQALELALEDAKVEIIKWVKEFRIFQVLPPGCYDVVIYGSVKTKKILYTLYFQDNEVVILKERKTTRFFTTGQIIFREGFISISYSPMDYCKNVVLPSLFLELFVMILIIIFVLKDKEKIQNITELQEAQRFRSLVHLTAGIAHNFRNDLSVIYGQLKLMRRESMAKLPDRPYTRKKVIDRIDIMDPVIDGMTKSIDKIVNITKEDINDKDDINLVDVLKTSVEMFIETIEEEIDVNFISKEQTVLCRGKRQLFNTVFLNLLNNAQQALEKSKIKKIDVALEVNNKIATIRVIDTGCGMNPETRSMVFVPFYTVNRTKGTGLGLSTSRSIIEQFDGKIDVESSIIGKGTTIKIELPLSS